jgi:hypothetical protein
VRQRRFHRCFVRACCSLFVRAFAPAQENQASIEAGGAEQRQAVAALGELVTASIRSSSALPTSALLLGSLFAEQHGVLTGTPGGSSQHGNGLVSSSGASLQAVATGMTWLADQLRQRGAAVVQLPQTTGSGEQQQLLLHLAGMLPRCCSVSGHGQASDSSARHEPVLRLQGGVEAALLQHSRINQLMPWFAAEGLVMAALLAASHGQQGVSAAELFDSAAFLRCVLAPEIDTGGLMAARVAAKGKHQCCGAAHAAGRHLSAHSMCCR